MAASGKLYYRTAAGTWAAVAVGSGGSSGGGGGSFDTDFAIKMSGDQTIANLTTAKISNYSTIIIDTNSEWDVPNLRWVCKTTGTYIINATLAWTANSAGYRNLYVYVDGVSVQGNSTPGSGTVSTNNIILYKTSLTAGQYVELYGRQNSGGNLDALAGTTPFEWQIWRYK